MDRASEQVVGVSDVVTSSVMGGPTSGQMRVVSVAAGRPSRPRRTGGSLAEANRWLKSHATQVDAYARSSTKRLIGRDEV